LSICATWARFNPITTEEQEKMASFLPLRDFNDYESMLATSTCNVGMSLTMVSNDHQNQQQQHQCVQSSLRQAWKQTVQERRQLQVKLVAKKGDVGPLGQRYGLSVIGGDNDMDPLFSMELLSPSDDSDNHQDKEMAPNLLLNRLQRIGTTALNISKGSYKVVCFLQAQEGDDTRDSSSSRMQAHVVISLCHALSDGPGAIRVARSFLMHLGKLMDTTHNNTSKKDPKTKFVPNNVQPLTDLQAVLLGEDYAKGEPENDVFSGQQDFTKALKRQPTPALEDGTVILPVEAMQNIPKDDGFGVSPSVVECTHFSLTAQETSRLRESCRQHETTVQGALVAAALKTRLKLLDPQPPYSDHKDKIFAAVQIPVNMRSTANVKDDVCLCGSAGVWHTARIVNPIDNQNGSNNATWWELAKASTQHVRAALHDNNAQHPREWLRRLLHQPATLPPYSMMVSSVGVAPIDEAYGNAVQVDQFYFFGGSLRNEQPSQAVGSMMHAVTFREEFHCLFNFTSPGISRAFAAETAKETKKTLVSFAAE